MSDLINLESAFIPDHDHLPLLEPFENFSDIKNCQIYVRVVQAKLNLTGTFLFVSGQEKVNHLVTWNARFNV